MKLPNSPCKISCGGYKGYTILRQPDNPLALEDCHKLGYCAIYELYQATLRGIKMIIEHIRVNGTYGMKGAPEIEVYEISVTDLEKLETIIERELCNSR